MKQDSLIDQAADALASGSPNLASELYEAAAREFLPTDAHAAAHHFLLAAQYGDESAERANRLIKDAQQIYQSEGDHKRTSEVALLQGEHAVKDGDSVRARYFYTLCVHHLATYVAELANIYMDRGDRSGFIDEVGGSLDILFYCRDQLRGLRS